MPCDKLSRKSKLKQQWATTVYTVVDSHNGHSLDTDDTNIAEDAGGNAKGAATLENSLAVSYKITYTLSIQFISHIPWYLPKGVENLCLHKICTRMFIAALFIIVKIWKQPKDVLQYVKG